VLSKLPSLLVVWVAWIGYSDWRYRRIPNVLSLGAWVVGIVLLVFKQTSLLGAAPSSALYGAGFGLLVTYPAYLMRKLGAGDVKLLVAMGLLTSLPVTIKAFVVAALTGAVIALVWLSINWWAHYLPERITQTGTPVGHWLSIPVHERRMAYGTLLALGLISSLWMEHA
jgi:prepilin peptidase CpaA